MADIGNLALKISADPTGAVRSLSQFQKSVGSVFGRIGKEVKDAFSNLPRTLASVFQNLNVSTIFGGGGIAGLLVGVGGPFGAIVQGALAAGQAIGKMVMETAALVDEMAKLSDRLGIAYEDFQGLAFAAELAGVSQSELETSMTMFSRVIGKGARGDTGAVEAFNRLGLSAQELAGMAPDKALLEVSRAMSKLGTDAERTAVATELFGRSGAGMLNFLESAHEQVAQANRDLQEFGSILSREQASGIEEMNDDVSRLGASFDAIIKQLTSALAPIIGGISEALSHIVAVGNAILTPLMRGIGDLLMPLVVVFRFIGQLSRLVVPITKMYYSVLLGASPILQVFRGIGDIFDAMLPAFDAVYDVFNAMLDSVNDFLASTVGQSIVGILNAAVEVARQGAGVFSEWIRSLTGVQQAAQSAGEAIADASKGFLGNSVNAMMQVTKELEDAAKRLNQQFADPLEAIQGNIEQLFQLQFNGLIDEDVFTRAMGDQISQLERLLGQTTVQLPQALEAGSSAAVSALNQFRVQSEGAQNPQERIASLLEQIRQQNAQALDFDRVQANALQQLLQERPDLLAAGV